MSEFNKSMRNIEDARTGRLKQREADESAVRRIVVDKRTHRVRLENETESEVTVVIEEKGGRR